MPSPRVLISRCLLGVACRYDGASRPTTALSFLPQDWIRLDLCPEEDLGMGMPRPPIELLATGKDLRLRECKGPRDWTRAMDDWCRFLARTLLRDGADGAVLKARSPSCGRGDVQVFALMGDRPWPAAVGTVLLRQDADGFLTRALREEDPGLPLINDEELADAARRQAFVAAVEARCATFIPSTGRSGFISPA